MFTIRRAQMGAFEVDASRRCAERLRAHLRVACPAQTVALSDAALLDEVERGVSHAAQYGFEAERDLHVFLECRLELGADFDTREDTAWAGAILRDHELFPGDKATFLADRALLTFAPEDAAR
jgi:hypothetical protein